ENADAPDFFRRLRANCRRQRYKAAGEGTNEASPVHYWITSSARSKSFCGTVSPNALAVLRLITKSTSVGLSTGMSPGLASRRIRSTMEAMRRANAGPLGPYDRS